MSDAVKKQQYEFDSLVLTVSLPAQLSVREVSPAASLLNDIQYMFFTHFKVLIPKIVPVLLKHITLLYIRMYVYVKLIV